MKSEISEPAPEVVACHEAGHLIIAHYCGRAVEKVSLGLIGGQRGCFYQPPGEQWTDYDEFLVLLAGPRAQVALCPRSIGRKKLERFCDRIIQPKEQHFEIPPIYDYTGWEHDVRPIYEMLMLPDAPVHGLAGIVTRCQALERAEEGLLRVFLDREILKAVRRVADILLERRKLTGKQAIEAVAESRVLELPLLQKSLQWQPG